MKKSWSNCPNVTKFYLHQLIPVLPRNSPVSVFQRKWRNPSRPCFSSGFLLKLNCFTSSFIFLSSAFVFSLTISVLPLPSAMVLRMFGVSTTDVLSTELYWSSSQRFPGASTVSTHHSAVHYISFQHNCTLYTCTLNHTGPWYVVYEFVKWIKSVNEISPLELIAYFVNNRTVDGRRMCTFYDSAFSSLSPNWQGKYLIT